MFGRYKKIKLIDNSKLGYDESYQIDNDGRGLINVGAENYDDLFSYYDLDGKTVLDKEFEEYLEAKADAIPMDKELTIVFHVVDANEEKRQEVEKTLKDSYIKEVYAINRKLKKNTSFSLSMLAVGLIMLSIYITMIALKINSIVTIIPEILTWIFIWEAVDSYFLIRRDLREEELYKFRFVQAKVLIKEYAQQRDRNVISNNAKKLNNIINSNSTNVADKEKEKNYYVEI